MAFRFPTFLFVCGAILFLSIGKSSDIEVGDVDWGRDLEAAFSASSESGKPIFMLFQEVPGCAGCQKFGREVLSHPQIVEAIESEFEPVLVYNNRPEDKEILKRFGEPAWNYQVVRFLDKKGDDVIPRQDKVWTTEALAARMVKALRASERPVPKYLEALGALALEKNLGTSAFAMYCFWTGEMRLGGINGVLATEAGFLDGREVVKVIFDRDQLDFSDLVAAASSYDCADKVFTTNSKDSTVAKKSRSKVAALTDDYRTAGKSDQKRQLGGTVFEKLELSPVQATKVNALARSEPRNALQWLSPEQIESLETQ